ncbi:MAG: hypothetical protein IK041_06590 [Bacteroidales bacterium]|nr:hypothetical protein [Bacteroidales bacterium]
MKRKGVRKTDESLEGFVKDLSSCPEWAAVRISRRAMILYIFSIVLGFLLCLGTLSVLLS